jgi:hypothetical protein
MWCLSIQTCAVRLFGLIKPISHLSRRRQLSPPSAPRRALLRHRQLSVGSAGAAVADIDVHGAQGRVQGVDARQALAATLNTRERY